jgi:hypothetical protein
MSTVRREIQSVIKSSLRGLHSPEDQDLCADADAEGLIFNMSSEHQTVDLSNKCMTKDFPRDFRHGCTV